jgi:hypothetical protein
VPFSITINTGAVPSWFAAQTVKTWQPVAAASDRTLLYANQNPPQNGGAAFPGWSFRPHNAYNGACVDQSRGEFLFAANGGHDDYAGNEVYACRIRSETPYWYRLTDRSPIAMIDAIGNSNRGSASTSNLISGQGWRPAGFAAMYGDGRMRAQHGWHSNIFANNRVWYCSQQSPTGVGDPTSHAWSFNRALAGIPQSPSRSPLLWQNNAGPFEWLGTSDNGRKGSSDQSIPDYGTASAAALDPVTGLIWYGREQQETAHWSSLNTANGVITKYGNGFGENLSAIWATVVYDPSGADLWRYFVLQCRSNPSRLYLLNLKQATPTWSFVTINLNPGAVSPNLNGYGAVYHPPSRSILLHDSNELTRDGRIMKVRVPTSGDAYAGGTWQVTPINPAGGSADPSTQPQGLNPAGGWYTWSKFNIINDMGNGQSALVVCMDPTLPTYVYKLPAGELF